MIGGTLNELYELCCEYYGFEFAGVQCRRQDIVDAKAMFAYIAHIDMQCTEDAVAKFVGWKSLSSVGYACRQMGFLVDRYKDFGKKYVEVKEAYEFRKVAGILSEKR